MKLRASIAVLGLALLAGCSTLPAAAPGAGQDNDAIRRRPDVRRAMDAKRTEAPRCEWCGREPVQVHHCFPIEYFPECAADKRHMVSLCEDCHFWVAHAGNWLTYVQDIETIVRKHKVKRGR